MGTLTSSWSVAFLWTCALELPVYVLLIGRRFERWWAVCLLTLALNAATHPALWLVFALFEPAPPWLIVAEAIVVVVEALIATVVLWRARDRSNAARAAWLAALVANTFSTVVGLVFR